MRPHIIILIAVGVAKALPTVMDEIQNQKQKTTNTKVQILDILSQSQSIFNPKSNITEPMEASHYSTLGIAVPTIQTAENTTIVNKKVEGNKKIETMDVQWLPLAIFFIVIFALCYWLCCNSRLCCDCPEFNHRSDENGRYGTCRPAMRKDRFQATCGYPHEPNVDPHQKYCGPNRLHRYKEPVIAIVDENDKILEDTYTLTNSYLNTADSKDEMRLFKFDLEEKRRLHQQRTEMINNLSRTRQMSAISESKEPAPVYTSRENIFKMWQAGVLKDEDAWSIHAPEFEQLEFISESSSRDKSRGSSGSSSSCKNFLNEMNGKVSLKNEVFSSRSEGKTYSSMIGSSMMGSSMPENEILLNKECSTSRDSMVKIASGRNRSPIDVKLEIEDGELNTNDKLGDSDEIFHEKDNSISKDSLSKSFVGNLDEQIVVVPYEQIKKEQEGNFQF